MFSPWQLVFNVMGYSFSTASNPEDYPTPETQTSFSACLHRAQNSFQRVQKSLYITF